MVTGRVGSGRAFSAPRCMSGHLLCLLQDRSFGMLFKEKNRASLKKRNPFLMRIDYTRVLPKMLNRVSAICSELCSSQALNLHIEDEVWGRGTAGVALPHPSSVLVAHTASPTADHPSLSAPQSDGSILAIALLILFSSGPGTPLVVLAPLLHCGK